MVHDLGADVLGVVEAESRLALQRFNVDLLRPISDRIYGHIMLIDGNDDRGIDVGVMTRGDHPIERIVSHVDDADLAGPVFGRDCPEYTVTLPGGARCWCWSTTSSPRATAPRATQPATRRQAERVAEIYRARRAEGVEHVVVLGDLNDTPDSRAAGAAARGRGQPPTCVTSPPTPASTTAAGRAPTRLVGPATRSTTCSAPPPCSPRSPRRRLPQGRVDRLRSLGDVPDPDPEQDAASDHAAIWADVDL